MTGSSRSSLDRAGTALLLAAFVGLLAPAAQAMAQSAPPRSEPLAVAPPSAAPAPASAKAPPSIVAEPLTVRGRRETMKARARSLIHGYSGKSHYWEALAGWDSDICVNVAGLEPNLNAAVKGRIEGVAKDMGVTVKQDGCGLDHVPMNIEVLFSDDPQRWVNAVARNNPWLVGGPNLQDPIKSVYQYRAGLIMKRPIQAWYTSACQDDTTWRGWYGGPCQKIMLTNVLVVVDLNKVQGKTLGLLADYAAMLVLSQPASLDGCNGLPSVIDLFSAGCADQPAPTGLTETDTAYLKALYMGGGVNGPPGYQAPGDVATRMAVLLVPDDAPAPERPHG